MNFLSGSSFMGSMNIFVPGLKDEGVKCSFKATEIMTSLMPPNTSSTFPMASLFSRKMCALKYGISNISHLTIMNSSDV